MDEQSLHNIGLLRNELEHADRILVGAGAGLSASAGLSYLDEAVFREHFPEMYALGYRCQYELVGMKDEEWSVGRKWAYWATHIHYVREVLPPLPLYAELKSLLEGKDFFVVTSNADRQFMRAGFPMERVFEYQGNYDVWEYQYGAGNKEHLGQQVNIRHGALVHEPYEEGAEHGYGNSFQ